MPASEAAGGDGINYSVLRMRSLLELLLLAICHFKRCRRASSRS